MPNQQGHVFGFVCLFVCCCCLSSIEYQVVLAMGLHRNEMSVYEKWISFVGKCIKLIKMLLYTICESTKEDKKKKKKKKKTVTLTLCGSLRH